MNYLLDTHIFLWCFLAPEKLNKKSIKLITDTENNLYLSAASCWEIMIKHQLGKLTLPLKPMIWIPQRMNEEQISSLAIHPAHAFALENFPPIHRDPFDRMLLAQAKAENLTIITADTLFKKYPVKLVMAQ